MPLKMFTAWQLTLLLLFATRAVSDPARPCSSESFLFPSIFGARHVQTAASLLDGYNGPGRRAEASLVGTDGVNACNVSVSYTHPGHGDTVTVQVWLPISNYNSRFVGVGGGGWQAGDIGGDIMPALTYQGYATVTTDGGYPYWAANAGANSAWLMKEPGNLDYPLFINFAYRALHDMTVIGKHITDQYYGEPPKFSYWYGCSTGGRQGLTMAQKYPEDYDGILTSCPAVGFPALLVAMYWPQFVMHQLGTYPPACQFEAVAASAVEACDKLDGVNDGIISRRDLCDFEPESVIGKEFDCQGTPSRITKETVEIVKAMLRGPTDPEGEQLFPGTTHGTAATGFVATANTLCADGQCTGGVPFPIAIDWIRLLVKKDPSFDPSTLTHEQYAQIFRESVREYGWWIGADDPDLQKFHEQGNKMIMWHSTNDEAISVNAAMQYYEEVIAADQKRGIDTKDYYRYFEVPGARHCGAPPGVPYPLNALDTLRLWVEDSITPEELDAVVLGKVDESDKVHHPICVYPKVGTLTLQGFQCHEPGTTRETAQLNIKDEL
ncbi:Tannase/feruloyl esterase [Biscogniauxia marginata]|nr:Tannase/feruloyl esterase [Biscogniauxia marginata]